MSFLVEKVVFLIFILELVGLGSIAYFFGIQSASTIAPYLVAFSIFPLAFKAFSQKRVKVRGLVFQKILILWLLLLVMSFLFSNVETLAAISSWRFYFSFWGLMIILGYANMSEDIFDRLWGLLFTVLLIQIPVVVTQYFVFARSSRMASWDAVVGTFGGDPNGGGNSAGLAFFIVVMILLIVDLNRERLMKNRKAGVLLGLCLFVILLAEIKAVFFLFPIGLLMLFRSKVLFNPIRSLMVATFTLAIISLIFTAYTQLYYSSAGRSGLTLEKLVESYTSVDYDQVRWAIDKSHLTRGSALALWYDLHISNTYSLIDALFGHGIGNSKYHTGSMGETIATHMGYQLDRNGISLLLWEVGVVGTGLYIAVLITGGVSSIRLSASHRLSKLNGVYLNIGGVSLLLMVFALFYKSGPVSNSIFLLLTVFFMGQAIHWNQKLAGVGSNGG